MENIMQIIYEHILFYSLFIIILFLLIRLFIKSANKSFLRLEYHKLPNHVERWFFRALKLSAIEHGYNGFLYRTRYFYKRLKDHILQVVSRIVPWSSIRVKLQKMRGVKIGRNVMIGPMVTIDDVYPDFVIIEDGVSLAGQNFILAHNKPLDFHGRLSDSFVAPTTIKKNAWVTVGVIVLPGVTIGEGSIVASGSVVTKDIPSNVLAGGVPAKVIKKFKIDNSIPIGYE